MSDQRNLIMAFVLSALVLVGWTVIGDRYFPQPKTPVTRAVTPIDAVVAAPAVATLALRPVENVVSESPRITIETPKLKGSLALKGARFDDLVLVAHTTTIKKDSPPVRLLSPAGTKQGYFAGFGWSGDGVTVPGPDSLWTADGAKLSPETPVTLNWTNGQGQNFQIKLSVDNDYMFTIAQLVQNQGTAPVAIRNYGYVSRSFAAFGQNSSLVGPRHDVDSWTMHVGPIGTFNGATNYKINYPDLDTAGAEGQKFAGKGGWLGFGDTYWLTALAPASGAQVDASFRKGGGSYQAEFAQAQSQVGAGKSQTHISHFFAGAKEVTVLDGYEKSLDIANFGKAIDWGWFEIVAKPIFYLLDWLFKLVGNFGVAIILLTLIVKTLMFPIAQKQFASMAGMRVLQPKIKALQERYKDDKQRQQTELMELYKKEKINPAAGCLPIFIQIPVFYALYKVLLLTIEMRHQPFALWIKDLSAPDPLTPVNLFGLLNFTPPSMIALGVLPILLGITMYLQFKLNPAPVDPVQAQVFSIMPWILMFVMAPFAAGLQLYWVVNNTLTILQQKWLYSRHPGMKAAVTK